MAAGQTRVANLESLSRGCHNAKTAGAWTVERVKEFGLRWRSLAGREYVTYPKDWREALHDPGSSPPAERHDEPTDSPGASTSSAPCDRPPTGELSDDPPPF